MNDKKSRLLLGLGIILCLLIATAAFAWRIKEVKDQRQRVLVIAFDDYSARDWESIFDLLDEYDTKVTFFINAFEPTDFCEKAIARGHEIGFHTGSHVHLNGLSEEEFYSEAIAPVEVFREKGIELTSFAYPYGEFEDWMHEELWKYYKTLRGAYNFEVRFKSEVPHCFIDSYSLDNIHFSSDEEFRACVVELLDAFCGCDEGTVASVFTHAIGAGDWCITKERLEVLLQEARKRDIKCTSFKELQ